MKKIENIRIENFKSLQNVTINNCKTYNIFIGQPNVGKSNILEALTLFAVPYLAAMNKSLVDLFRLDECSSLFYNGDISQPIKVNLGVDDLEVVYNNSDSLGFTIKLQSEEHKFNVIDLKVEKSLEEYSIYKPYFYESRRNLKSVNMPFLCPVGGENLMQVVQNNEELRKDFIDLLKGYDLRLTFDNTSQQIKIMKDLSDTSSCIFSLEAMADSLKRLMFYKAAVMSNQDSVLFFEEPEAHSYPPYIVKIIQTILNNPANQYFITTHSPYILNEFLSDSIEDLAIHLVDYKEGKTIVRTLSEEEIVEVYNNGIDLFFNIEAFLS